MARANALREAALEYCGRGWSVIPLCWPGHPPGYHRRYSCEPKKQGKAPLVPWKAHQTHAADRDLVAFWWDEFPSANVGVVMGAVSNLVAWDIDDHDGWTALLTMVGGKLDMNWMFRTGSGGWRILYGWPDGAPPAPKHFTTGSHALTFLGEGSYTVMPPSRHHAGGRYYWEKEMGPDTLPKLIAPPNMVEALCREKAGGRKRGGVSVAVDDLPASVDRHLRISRGRGYARGFQPAIDGQGGRKVAFTLACALVHGLGLTVDEALDVMMAEWNGRCVGPWEREELREHVQGAADRGHFAPIPHRPYGEGR